MKNQTLICNPEHDIIFIPFSPISETDKLEVRVQIRNFGIPREIIVEIYLDNMNESCLAWRGKTFAKKNQYAFAQCFPDIIGKAGSHKVVVRFSDDGKNWTSIEKSFEVRTHTPNLLEGAFIMFGPPSDRKPCSLFYGVKELTDIQWQEQMDFFNELGFKMIIPMSTIQFEIHGKVVNVDGEKSLRAHYPSQVYPKSDIKAEDPVNAIFEAAERNGQKIFLPFGCNYRICAQRMKVMKELWERYGHYKSFYGWYQSYESPLRTSGKIFESYLKLIEEDRKMIDELSPAKPLMISILCGLDAISDTVAIMLSQGLCKANIITPMDMVGMNKGRLEQLKINARSFSKLKDALKKTDIHIWGNCESFDYDSNIPIMPRFRNGGFDGQAGFVQQIETIRPYSEKLVTFLAEMFAKPRLTPEIGGPKAVDQYKRYKEYMTRPMTAYRNIALERTYSKSRVPTYPGATESLLIAPNKYGFIPDENNSLSTDGYIYGGCDGLIDIDKIYGYKVDGYKVDDNNKFEYVDILFDLEKFEQIDMLRVAESPLSPWAGIGTNNPDASPDSIVIEVGSDLKSMSKIGKLSDFVNGWAKIVLPSPVNARFVKFIFNKAKKPDYNDGSLMLINEIEICQKFKE